MYFSLETPCLTRIVDLLTQPHDQQHYNSCLNLYNTCIFSWGHIIAFLHLEMPDVTLAPCLGTYS